MGHIDYAMLLTVLGGALVLFAFRRGLMEAVADAINRFGGGPPTPMHPSPVNDAALLRRRSKRAVSASSNR